MKRAADFRAIARDALKGKWWIAVLTGFVASLLGGVIAFSNNASFNIDMGDSSLGDISSDIFSEEVWLAIAILSMVLGLLFSFLAVARFVVGGPVKMGYSVFNLNLVDKKETKFGDLFSCFNRFGAGFCMNLLMGIFIFLWSLLFVIPGIIKRFSYAMTPYVLAENPQMTARQAITRSRWLMDGNKWRLFCLNFSFIGWGLLSLVPALICTVVIGMLVAFGESIVAIICMVLVALVSLIPSLFLQAYQQAAYAAFYRDIAGSPKPSAEEMPEEENGGFQEC